uniref:Uncharacterized protein n=1 Tax=Panagrolaimus sp. JU765 TaxID=591449 RepID=A0AC34Q6E6_9BILA
MTFSDDEVSDVLNIFKQNSESLKPIFVLMNYIKKNEFTDKEIKSIHKLLEKLPGISVEEEKLRFDVNQGADHTLVDRLLLMRSYC